MSNMFQPRYDEERGIYRDCKWCQGKGCLQCPAEAEKEYKRQFPDGPKPIATFDTAGMDDEQKRSLIAAIAKAVAAGEELPNFVAVR